MNTQEQRHKIVLSALSMTENTAIAPSHYERHLLAQFVQGLLTIEQVVELLEVHNYHSMSSAPAQQTTAQAQSPKYYTD